MTVYVCQDNFDSMLCGVYDAWMSRLGHQNVRLELEGQRDPELFCQYRRVEASAEKAAKVISAVREKISEDAYEQIYVSSLSQDGERADCIYRFLICGFHYGARIMDLLQLPPVYEIFRMCRFVWNETHLLKEFVRFSQTDSGLLVSRIGPKNDVLTLLAPHFSDRLPDESWLIYDEKRRKAAVHPAGEGWMIVMGGQLEQEAFTWRTDEKEFEALWKTYYHAIAIRERRNLVCQRNHLPLRYRAYMTEFN